MGSVEQYNVLSLAKPVICVVGPTASGKSELAQRIAETLDGEVVSADSMQVYRGMDIGTGKVLAHDRRVPHHGLDLVNPGEPYSAALYQAYARNCFSELDARGKRTILCGGTGFYVRAAIDGYDFPAGEQVGNAIRDTYLAIAKKYGSEYLWNLLNDRDPKSASIIPQRDTKRIVRAFELLDSNTSYAHQREKLASIPQVVPAHLFGLKVDPDVLAKRIEMRVDSMIGAGLVQEVIGLISQGFREGITAPQAIGYKEIVCTLDGDITLDEAIDQIKTTTRRYAKRQRTWFRKDTRIQWIDANDLDYDSMVSKCMEHLDTTA